MDGNIFGEACAEGVFFYDPPYVDAIQTVAGAREEKEIFALWFNELRSEMFDVFGGDLTCDFAEGYDPFFAALAEDSYVSDLEVDVGYSHFCDFACAGSGCVEHFEYCFVAETVWVIFAGGIEDFYDLFLGGDSGESFPEFWALKHGGEIFLDGSGQNCESEHHFNGYERATDGCFCFSGLAEFVQIGVYHGGLDLFDGADILGQAMFCEMGQVASIG